MAAPVPPVIRGLCEIAPDYDALLLDQWGHFGGAQRVALEVLALWRDWGWAIDAAFPLGGAFEAAVRRELDDAVQLHDLRLPALTTGRKTLRDAWRLWRAGAEIADSSGNSVGTVQSVEGDTAVVIKGGKLYTIPLSSIYHDAAGKTHTLVTKLSQAEIKARTAAAAESR